MLCSSMRREWYTRKSELAAAAADAVHTNPEDPLDTCNLVLLDSLRAALVVPTVMHGGIANQKRLRDEEDQPDEGHRALGGTRFSRRGHHDNKRSQMSSDNASSSALQRQLNAEKRARSEILHTVVLAPTPTTASSHSNTTRGDNGVSSSMLLSLQSGLESLFDTTSHALLSPCFDLDGDDLKLVAAHMKRVDRMESHRALLRMETATSMTTPLTESELMQREMKELMAIRRKFSRVRN